MRGRIQWLASGAIAGCMVAATVVAVPGATASSPATSAGALSELPVLPAQKQEPGPVIRLTKKQRAAADATKHIVVLFMQNNSFDKLYGRWGKVGGEAVDGVANAPASAIRQVNQDGQPIRCAMMNDVNLAPGGLAGSGTCTDKSGVAGGLYPSYTSPYPMRPFVVDDPLPAGVMTCPAPGQTQINGTVVNSEYAVAGGCTRNLVHEFYTEQYQLNGGKMNRYAVGSDATGLVMGQYDTKALRVYRYLMGRHAPRFAVADRFFSGVFGGSYANGQWLIAATLPKWAAAPDSVRSVLDSNGMGRSQTPATATSLGNWNYYLSPEAGQVAERSVTQSCDTIPVKRLLCGDWVVDTAYSVQWPYPPGTALPSLVPLATYDTVGDRLDEAGVSWGYYSGGWANANGLADQAGWTNGSGPVPRIVPNASGYTVNEQGCPDPSAFPQATWPLCPDMDFQFHHQAFNYFYNWSTATPETSANRANDLRDSEEFLPLTRGRTCNLRDVSFVQQVGERNQHPGYASAYVGDAQIALTLKSIYSGPCAKDTLTIVTYDEFGGAWDHVPPPGMGTKGAHDAFGPGTRIPSLVISRNLPRRGVDSTVYDLASVIGTITSKYRLQPVNRRDSQQKTIWTAWSELSRR